MLDALNCMACGVLLFLTFPVAAAMNHSGYWAQRITLWFVVIILGAEVIAPFSEIVPNATWTQAVFNLLLMLVVLSARRQIMALVRATVGEEAFAATQPAEIRESLLHHVHGRGKD